MAACVFVVTCIASKRVVALSNRVARFAEYALREGRPLGWSTWDWVSAAALFEAWVAHGFNCCNSRMSCSFVDRTG